MQHILVETIGSFKITEQKLRPLAPGEVCLKVRVTGVCRTDLKLIRTGHRDLVLPRVPGEEVVGEVCAMASDVTGFCQGQRVYVYPGVWCGQCPSCRRGAENLCREMQIMGFHRDGGFADYVIAPAMSLIPVPGGLSDEEAVFAEPLSCCLNALELGRVAQGTSLGIWGAGPAGTLLKRAAEALGASVEVIEPDARRRALIGGREQGPKEGVDAAIVAVGSLAAYQEALACLRPRGLLVAFSGLAPASDPGIPGWNQLLNQFHYLEQTVVGAYGCCFRHGVQALEFLAQGRVAVGDMISHRLPLSSLEEALGIVERREGMKVLLYPGGIL